MTQALSHIFLEIQFFLLTEKELPVNKLHVTKHLSLLLFRLLLGGSGWDFESSYIARICILAFQMS